MGQRLNIEIVKGSKLLANSYYHWSGFTSSSIALLKEIQEFMKENKNEDDLLYAIKILESTGAGLTDNEVSDEEIEFARTYYNREYFKKWLERVSQSQRKIAQNLYPNETFSECCGRNNGLIAITDAEMDNTRSWEEARATIDLETSLINFQVLWDCSVEEFRKNYEKEPTIKAIDLDFGKLTFDDLDCILNMLKYDKVDLIKDVNGKTFQFIE